MLMQDSCQDALFGGKGRGQVGSGPGYDPQTETRTCSHTRMLSYKQGWKAD